MRRTNLLTAVVIAALASGSALAQETLDNPEFANWKKFKVGASITVRTTSTIAGLTSEILMTTRLVELGADKHVVETSTVSKFGGMEFKAPATKRDVLKSIALPKGTPKPDPKAAKPEGTYEEGTETLKIGGVEVKTKWYKYKSDSGGLKIEAKTWISDDVPGSLVKMEAATGGLAVGTTKVELIEFKKP